MGICFSSAIMTSSCAVSVSERLTNSSHAKRSSTRAFNSSRVPVPTLRPLLSASTCALLIQLSSLPKAAAFEVCNDGLVAYDLIYKLLSDINPYSQVANACDHSGPTFVNDGFDKIPIIIGVVVGVCEFQPFPGPFIHATMLLADSFSHPHRDSSGTYKAPFAVCLLSIAAGTFAFYRWRRIRRFQEEYRRRAQEGLRAENAAYGPPYAGGPTFTGGTMGQSHMMSSQPPLITSPPTTTRSWFGSPAYEPVGQPADAYHPHVGGFGGMDAFHHGGMQSHDYFNGGGMGMGHNSGGMGMSSSSGV